MIKTTFPPIFATACLLLAVGISTLFANLPTQEPVKESAALTASGADCSLCHQNRHQLFIDGAHGQEELECVDCHQGADGEHVESLGQVAAPHPQDYSGSKANKLCIDCHEVRSSKFADQHQDVLWQERPVCIGCHNFHELTEELETASPIKFSHGAGVARPFQSSINEKPIRGGFSVGYRFLNGANPGFGTNLQLSDGVLLRDFRLETELDDESSLKIEGGGFGDSSSRLRLSWQQADNFQSSLQWRRYEDLFNPDSELHDMFTNRQSIDLRWQALSGDWSDVEFSWQRFQRSSTTEGTRYRPPTNALFDNASGVRDEVIDSLSAEWTDNLDDWNLKIRPSLRWWQEDDQRSFSVFNAAVGADDFENLRSDTSGLNPNLHLSATSNTNNSIKWSHQLYASYAKRNYTVSGEAGGELAVGGPYSSVLDADGELQGRYLRFETNGWWQLNEFLAADINLRIRDESEEATVPFSEILSPDPGANSIDQVAETKADLLGLDVEAMLQSRSVDWIDIDLGVGMRFEKVQTSSGELGSPRDGGLLLGLRSKPHQDWTLSLDSRAFSVSDPYTITSADTRQRHQLRVNWQGDSKWGMDSAWSHSDIRFAVGDDYSEMNRAHVYATWGDSSTFGGRAGLSWNSYETKVDSIANTPMPSPWLVLFSGSSYSWHASAFGMINSSLKFNSSLDLVEVLGDNTSNLTMAKIAITKAWNPFTEIGAMANWWLYDGVESDFDDFDVLGLEIFISRLF